MATGKIRGDSNVTVLFRNEKFSSSPRSTFGSLWSQGSSSARPGSSSTDNLENASKRDAVGVGFLQQMGREDEVDEDVYGNYLLNPQAKKRRLTASQLRVLEKNFEEENKLEPERKVQLAKELGLQPRHVAIWFQNRRARFKNKQLEKDCNYLRASYDKLKADYDILLKESKSLKDQVSSLRQKQLIQENTRAIPKTQKLLEIESQVQFMDENLSAERIKEVNKLHEEASSAKSDVFDSESPQHGSSHGFEPREEEEEEDGLAKRFLETQYCIPKLEDDGYYCDPHLNYYCNLGFQMDDHQVWPWLF